MGVTLGPGTVLGDRYRLDRKLGQGGMGVVWAATDMESDGPVALKLLTSTDDEAKRRDLQLRLRREARAARAVEHPNLVRIFDVLDLEDGSPALVMEHLHGESLAARIEGERVLELDEFARIFVKVLAGVGAVHAHGIVHRDLKPENIFLVDGTPPEVKVLDFGIAKLTATEGEIAAGTALTASGAVLGTPCYMSPEQFGERDVDVRTDVWSMGLIAYRCLSGVLPTHGENIFDVFRKIVDRPVPPLEEIAPDLPSEVTELVGRMLARRRDARPGDLREVIDVFARHAGPTRARASGGPALQPAVRRDSPSNRPVDALATTYAAQALAARGAPPSTGGAVRRPAAASNDVARPASGGGPPRPRRSRQRRMGVAAIGAAALAAILLVRARQSAAPSGSPKAPVDHAVSSAPTTNALSPTAPESTAADVPSPMPSAPPATAAAVARTTRSPRSRALPPAASAAPATRPTAHAAPPLDDGLVKEPPF